MADINVENRAARPTMTWGWIGLGILLLAVLAWLIYSFGLMGTEPDPPPVEIDRSFPGQSEAAPATPAPAPGQTSPNGAGPGATAPQGQTGP